jgi:opacity protein-like surface antigen
MTKRAFRQAGLVVLLGAGLAIPATAQTRIGVGVGAGGALPIGDFGDHFNTGWVAGAGLTIMPATAPVGFRVDAHYGSFSEDGHDAKIKPLVFAGGVVLPLGKEGGLRPYVAAGGGMASVKFDDEDHPEFSKTTTKFSWYGAGGLSFQLGDGGARLFVETRFVSIATEESATNYIPLIAGISFGLGGRR